jgi:methylated-DNA-[protein]-cysteine S-methyltransferase
MLSILSRVDVRLLRQERTPIGEVLLVSDGDALTDLYLPGTWQVPDGLGGDGDDVLAETSRQLAAYFAGRLQQFELPLKPTGPGFHRKVWQALLNVPFGTTISYSQLGRLLDPPGNSRAVGLANARNPIPIIIPCHRVIGADGGLVGYGGGLDRKRWLLDHEAGIANLRLPFI